MHNPDTDQNGGDDPHCLIKWNPDGTGGEFASKDTPELCTGNDAGCAYCLSVYLCIYMLIYHAFDIPRYACKLVS